MQVINAEIKARCRDHGIIKDILLSRKAEFRGADHQKDTYFFSREGRLKMREGNIENRLIYYKRPDRRGPKTSDCILYGSSEPQVLKKILEKSAGIMVVVDKTREIWFLDNIKVHLDVVEGLGRFLEIEAQSVKGDLTEEYLTGQCRSLMKDFGLDKNDLVDRSYSDLLMEKG